MVKPFLRWAGGKRWLAAKLGPMLAERLEGGTYYEPFLGSAAMFFAVRPKRACLSDINAELVNTYKQLARHSESIRRQLNLLKANRKEYCRVRALDCPTPLGRAVRFLFLNRNCWGGLYRENKQGVFNVPYGGVERNHRSLIKGSLLSDASEALRKPCIKVQVSDFEANLSKAGAGDVVYCDPTYRKLTRHHFDRYGANIFGWDDQKRLAKVATTAWERGALVVISNATCFGLKELYPSALILELFRKKGIGNEDKPSALCEYLFVLDPAAHWSSWRALGKTVYSPASPFPRSPAGTVRLRREQSENESC